MKKNYDGINFYDVFDRLLSMEEKADEFKEGKTYEIPKESFEAIFQKYFNISAEILQTGTVFHTETQTYRYRTRGIVYDFAPTPYIPYPEVVFLHRKSRWNNNTGSKMRYGHKKN